MAEHVEEGLKAVTAKRMKKPNFSEAEMGVLIEEVGQYSTLLFSSFTNAVTNKKKNDRWENITGLINAVGGNGRTVSQVKKRFKDAKSAVVKRKQQMNGTGGGPPPPPVPYEDAIMDILGENTCLTNGIPGADELDSIDLETSMIEEQCKGDSQFKPIMDLEDFSLIDSFPVGTQIQQLDIALPATPRHSQAVTVEGVQRPSSTPPRLERVGKKKKKSSISRRELFDSSAGPSSKSDHRSGSSCAAVPHEALIRRTALGSVSTF